MVERSLVGTRSFAYDEVWGLAAEDGRAEAVVMAAVGLEVVEREAVSLGKAVAVKAGGVKEAVSNGVVMMKMKNVCF